MLLSVLAVVVAIAYGWGLLGWLAPAPEHSWPGTLIRASVATLLGLGLSSLLFFGWLVVVGHASRWYFMGEAALGSGILLAAWRRRRRSLAVRSRDPLPPAWVVSIPAVVVALLGSAMIAYTLWINPHGAYDAWAIWNAHARFLFRSGPEWRQVFAPFATAHADYPYLLPATVARTWTAAGNEGLIAPALIALLSVASAAGLLLGGLTLLADRTRALLASAALFLASHYVYTSSSLMADVPISALFLATLVALCLGSAGPSGSPGWISVAGICAGLAAWTKNEGLLFAMLVGGIWGVAAWRAQRRQAIRSMIAPFVAGLAPVLLAVVVYKATLAPPSDLSAGLTLDSMTEKLATPARYASILKIYVLKGVTYGRGAIPVLLIYSLLAGLQWPAALRLGRLVAVLTVLALLGGYTLIYLLTPHDLLWHLTSSLDRLIVQVWPSLIFCVFLSTQPLARSLGPQTQRRDTTPDLPTKV